MEISCLASLAKIFTGGGVKFCVLKLGSTVLRFEAQFYNVYLK